MKNFVWVLALVLVFAISSLTTAEQIGPSTPLQGHVLNGDLRLEDIEVTVDVAPFVYLGVVNTESMLFELDSPATMGEAYNIVREFTFATNTPVVVELKETLTGQFAATDALHTAVLLQPKKGQKDDFSYTWKHEITGQPGLQHASARYGFAPGIYSGQMNVGLGWYYTNSLSNSNGQWDDLDWWKVKAGEYSGRVTITIQDAR